MSSKLGAPGYILYVPQVPAHAQQHHFQQGGNAFFQQPTIRKRKNEPGQMHRDKALWS